MTALRPALRARPRQPENARSMERYERHTKDRHQQPRPSRQFLERSMEELKKRHRRSPVQRSRPRLLGGPSAGQRAHPAKD